MPKVPYSDNVVPMAPSTTPPSETMFAMAAALMHSEGRLFNQDEKPLDTITDRTSSGSAK